MHFDVTSLAIFKGPNRQKNEGKEGSLLWCHRFGLRKWRYLIENVGAFCNHPSGPEHFSKKTLHKATRPPTNEIEGQWYGTQVAVWCPSMMVEWSAWWILQYPMARSKDLVWLEVLDVMQRNRRFIFWPSMRGGVSRHVGTFSARGSDEYSKLKYQTNQGACHTPVGELFL